MITKIYTVHDAKSEAYLQPFFQATKGIAIRAFTEAANAADHQFNKYPEDFTLFELGEFDDSTASFQHHPTPLPVVKAIEVIKP